MIVKREFYGVKCDKCGKMQCVDCDGLGSEEGYFDFYESGAEAVALINGWWFDGEKHYCEECHEKLEKKRSRNRSDKC